MPIQIQIPQTANSWIGPAIRISAHTDFVGPPSGGFHWTLGLSTDPEFIARFWQLDQVSDQTGVSTRPFVDTDHIVNQGATVFPADRQQVRIVAQFFDGSTLLETLSEAHEWRANETIGLQNYLQTQTTGQGGFTADDRAMLTETNVATMSVFPTQLPNLGTARVALSKLVEGPPDELLRRGETVLLSGEGSLTRPGPASSVNAYGAIWDFQFVPPGFGFAIGPIREYDRRMAQFVVISRDAAGNEFSDQLLDVRSSFGKLRFPISTERIDYKIAPGVILAWTWLIFVVLQ